MRRFLAVTVACLVSFSIGNGNNDLRNAIADDKEGERGIIVQKEGKSGIGDKEGEKGIIIIDTKDSDDKKRKSGIGDKEGKRGIIIDDKEGVIGSTD
ncbi:MAG: hypothetical protein ACYSTI_09365 [Planctomycetota bacterium]|jgi:hypothetical protein